MIRRKYAPQRLALALVLTVVAAPALAQKGKPAPPPPPPPPAAGTIYFWMQEAIWSMKADGSGKTPDFAWPGNQSLSEPSSRVYSKGRWYLRVERPDPSVGDQELYALRLIAPGQFQKVRVTSISPEMAVYGNIRWSNDGDDSFISFHAGDDREYWDTGDESKVRFGLYRIPVSGADIEEAANLEPTNPLVSMNIDATQVEDVVSMYTWYESLISGPHSWSPDGNRIAYFFRPTVDTTHSSLLLRDLITRQVTTILPLAYSNQVYTWSPAGDEILVCDNSIRVYSTSGALLRTVLAGDAKNWYQSACWSPDGSHFVFRHLKVRNGSPYAWTLARVPALGGTITQLTNDLDPSLGKALKSWVSDEPFEP